VIGPAGAVTYVAAPRSAPPATAVPAASAPAAGRARGGLVLAAYRSGNGQPLGDIATLFPGEPAVPGLFLATDPSGSNLLVSDTAMRVDVVNVVSRSVAEVPVLGEAANARLVSVAW
jgi:hypothetical protein